jgi:hypothetical protein
MTEYSVMHIDYNEELAINLPCDAESEEEVFVSLATRLIAILNLSKNETVESFIEAFHSMIKGENETPVIVLRKNGENYGFMCKNNYESDAYSWFTGRI